MKIKVDLKIFLILVLFIITKQIEIYSMFMIFIFIHELAHLLAGVLCGLKPEKMEIMPVRDINSFQEKRQDKNSKTNHTFSRTFSEFCNIHYTIIFSGEYS